MKCLFFFEFCLGVNGYNGIVYGGIVVVLIDEVMGNLLVFNIEL